MKLGCIRSKPDPQDRTLRMSQFMAAMPEDLPPLPPERDWTRAVAVPWGMMRNDEIGDCVVAAAGHAEMGWTFNAGHGFTPSDEDIVKAYSAVGGYDPNNPGTDRGLSPLAFLKYWRKVGLAGRKIGAFVQLDNHWMQQFQYAIELFGNAYIALGLPKAVQGLNFWDIPDYQSATGDWTPWSWGGHMVTSLKYDQSGAPTVTWGDIKPMSWRFVGTYAFEAYAILSPDMLNDQGFSPNGFNMPYLRSRLHAVTHA